MRPAFLWAIVAGLGFTFALAEGQARWEKAHTDYAAMRGWAIRLQEATADAIALQRIVDERAAENTTLRIQASALQEALARAEAMTAAVTRRAASPSHQDVRQLSRLLRVCANPSEVVATQ